MFSLPTNLDECLDLMKRLKAENMALMKEAENEALKTENEALKADKYGLVVTFTIIVIIGFLLI